MMIPVILGLDIGGANIKACTSDRRAKTWPFPLWKQPEKLAGALVEIAGEFPSCSQVAITMTGELCDCFESKRHGVHAILDAVEQATAGTPVAVWSTQGAFLSPGQARAAHMEVAASNWHALASLVGRWTPPQGPSLLIDIGSTTTDLIPIHNGSPATQGRTDPTRMQFSELVYAGVRRTPVMALFSPDEVAAEYFAGLLDVFLTLGRIAEDPADCDTADGRPATRSCALSRLARMLGGDRDITPESQILEMAHEAHKRLTEILLGSIQKLGHDWQAIVTSGSGEFLARELAQTLVPASAIVSLSERLGPVVSSCAPAYAVALLAQERLP